MITSLYAGLLSLLFMVITFATIGARRKNKISLGAGEKQEIVAIVSAHANFSAYTIYFLFMLFLAEYSELVPRLLLHALGAVFLVGRILHYQAFKGEKMDFKQRVLGMQMTLLPLMFLAVLNIGLFAYSSIAVSKSLP